MAQSPVAVDTPPTYTISNGENVVGVFTAAEAVNGKTIGDDFGPTLTVKTKLLKAGKNGPSQQRRLIVGGLTA